MCLLLRVFRVETARLGPDLQDKIKTGELLAKSERWELLTAFHEQYCSATESL